MRSLYLRDRSSGSVGLAGICSDPLEPRRFLLSNLAPGTYRIREVRLDGWTRTKPSGTYPLGYYDVTVGIGQLIGGKDFGHKQ